MAKMNPREVGDQHSFSKAHEADGRPLLVLKVGTSTMMATEKLHFSLTNLGRFVDAVCSIKAEGYQVVLVCSGAVGAGCIRLKLTERPSTLQGKQAASAVGQCHMMRIYEDLFAIREQKIAQLIITRPDLMDRSRFINFKNALKEILKQDVLPIINENDSIATSNLHFGDNDTLAAYVAVSLGAQWLYLLTDVDCLYTRNPRLHADALPIFYVEYLDELYHIFDEAEYAGTAWGTGGMRTKLIAAKISAAAGTHTALCHGSHPERVLDVLRIIGKHAQTPQKWAEFLKNFVTHQSAENEPKSPVSMPHSASAISFMDAISHHHAVIESNSDIGMSRKTKVEWKQPAYVTAQSLRAMPYLATIFAAQESTQNMCDQRRWILSLPVKGRIYVDDGAARAVIEGKKSLFAAGVVAIEGIFYEGECVVISRDCCIRRGKQHEVTKVSPLASSSTRLELDKLDLTKHYNLKLRNHERKESFSDKSGEDAEIAHCLVNFSSAALNTIKGLKSSAFEGILGHTCDAEVAHRNNIIFINPCVVYGCHHHECDSDVN